MRRLVGAPAIVAAVVASIGIGIAANATIFAMVNRFVLRSAPVGNMFRTSGLDVWTRLPEWGLLKTITGGPSGCSARAFNGTHYSANGQYVTFFGYSF